MKLLLTVFAYCMALQPNTVTSDESINLRPALETIYGTVDTEAIQSVMSEVDLVTCVDKLEPRALPYLHSEDFKTIHNFVWSQPQFLKLMKLISDGGVPEVYEGFNTLYKIFGLPYRVASTGSTENGNLEESSRGPCPDPEMTVKRIQGAFPEEEMTEMVFDLLSSDSSVKALIAFLKTPEMKEFYAALLSLPEVERLLEYGKEKGLPMHTLVYFMS